MAWQWTSRLKKRPPRTRKLRARLGVESLEERSLMDACDPKKVGVVFPQVTDRASLEAFVDSEHNLMVLCDVHHRHPLHGIHHLAPQDFFVQPFLLEGYEVVVTKDQQDAAMKVDEQVVAKDTKKNGK